MLTLRTYDIMIFGGTSKDQKLTGTDIRGVNDPCPRVLMENPNSFVLFFRDYYKHDNKNPRAKYVNNYIGLGKKTLSRDSESKFRERVEKKKKSSGRDQRKRVEMIAMMMMMMMMNLMIMMIVSIKIVKVTSYRFLKQIETEVEIPL